MNANIKMKDGKLICKICGKELKSTLSIGGHMSGHSRMNTTAHKRHLICKICNKEFRVENCLTTENKDIYCKSLCDNCRKLSYKRNIDILKANMKLTKDKDRKYKMNEKDKERIRQFDNYREILKELVLFGGDQINGYDEFEMRLLKKRLIKNNFRCEICGKKITDIKDLNIDHDHSTLKLRGMLCMHCNTIVGKYENYSVRLDNLELKPINKNKLNNQRGTYRDYKRAILSEYKSMHVCPYCGMPLIGKKTYCDRQHMILFGRELHYDYMLKTKAKVSEWDNDICQCKPLYLDHYSIADVIKIKESNNRCILCNKYMEKDKYLIVEDGKIYGICCMPCKRIYSDIISYKDKVNKYLSSCRKKSFNDKYYDDLVAVHRSKEYQDALNFKF